MDTGDHLECHVTGIRSDSRWIRDGYPWLVKSMFPNLFILRIRHNSFSLSFSGEKGIPPAGGISLITYDCINSKPVNCANYLDEVIPITPHFRQP